MAQKAGYKANLLGETHPEDVKAAIRKQFGTISRFVEARNLPTTGVSDLLRGRPSRRVSEAVEAVLQAQQAPSGRITLSSENEGRSGRARKAVSA